ncbi:MAG: hypothetical protein C0501_20185 [Isosphaera sp.]|nr:hypothetical protein [Isosphaera sp.]
MPLPPLEDLLLVLEYVALPAAGGAALVAAALLLLGRRAGAAAAAAGVAFGFAWANHSARHLGWDAESPLLPWTPGDDAKPWHHLPRAAFVLLAVGLLTRWVDLVAGHYLPERRWWVANVLVWVPRAAAVGVVSNWLVSEKTAGEVWWLVPALAAAMLLEWVALDGVARAGAGGQVAAYQSAVFVAASVLMLYHHWASASHVALMLGGAMFGVAVVAGLAKADASGAVPAGVGVLPALLLAAHVSQDSNIPQAAFWLVALAPLVLLPFLVPAVARRDRWFVRLARAVLVLAPLVAALALAARHEQLAFE